MLAIGDQKAGLGMPMAALLHPTILIYMIYIPIHALQPDRLQKM